MKWNTILALIFAAVLLVLPLQALPAGSVPKPEESRESKDTQAVSVPAKAQTDAKFAVWDQKSEKVIRMNERDFIFYTVAAEMPVAYGEEALKAQTVASYTYFCYRRQARQSEASDAIGGADFADVPSCFPEGYSDEYLKEKWGKSYSEHYATLQKAVDSVFGKTLTYQNKPILAAYHAISCGSTESAAVVWNTEYPYLTSVPCPGDTLAEGYETTVRLTPQQLASALAGINGISLSGTAGGWIGKISRSAAGTVTAMEVGGQTVTGRQVRKLLGLRSAAFAVDFANGSFQFTVRGYGHGVGMSQYGAGYLARQGMSYAEILQYFYSGAELTG